MAWYVIQISPGQELNVMRQLRLAAIDAFAPMETVSIHKNGEWKDEQRYIFPGYILIHEQYTLQLHAKIVSMSYVQHFLPIHGAEPLPEHEAAYISFLACDILRPSFVDFSGEKPVPITGVLMELGKYVVEYRRRQRRALLEIELYGKPHQFFISIMDVSNNESVQRRIAHLENRLKYLESGNFVFSSEKEEWYKVSRELERLSKCVHFKVNES